MKRAAIYARFSSDRQNDKSCQDQINQLRPFVQSMGYEVVAIYKDEAMSGYSTVNRSNFINMMNEAKQGKFETIFCEDLFRISRAPADIHAIRRDLEFYGVSIHSQLEGEVGWMQAGIKSLLGEGYLIDLSHKTKRGLKASLEMGKHNGGRAFGYDIVLGKKGELKINEEEAKIVRRIFDEYLAGSTPRQIATRLNKDGIRSPRGGKWNASTINGSAKRANGILQNKLYVGVYVWNRHKYVKNPETGKRISRLNAESEWLTHELPHLRIIDDATFNKASAIKEKKGRQARHQSQRSKYLLSGLLQCACCNGGYIAVGRNRIGCSSYRERGDCTNNRTVSRTHVEQRVTQALQERLAKPDMIEQYIKSYHDERKKLEKSGKENISEKRKKLELLTAGIERIVDRIVDGIATKSELERINKMEQEQEALKLEIDSLKNYEVISIHPGISEKYKRIVSNIQEKISAQQDSPARDLLISEVRQLIDKVVITPTPSKQPVKLTVYGQLAVLLQASMHKENLECGGAMVAGAGFEPTTFGL